MAAVLIDWSKITTIDEFYNLVLPQCGSPTWHRRNLDALADSWITGGIDAAGPPFAFTFLSASSGPPNFVDFQSAALRIALESVAANGGSCQQA